LSLGTAVGMSWRVSQLETLSVPRNAVSKPSLIAS
jgi:hypothetical protein